MKRAHLYFAAATAATIALLTAVFAGLVRSPTQRPAHTVSDLVHKLALFVLIAILLGIVWLWRFTTRRSQPTTTTSRYLAIPRNGSPATPPIRPAAFRSLQMLGLTSPVTVQSVKNAYRIRAARLHPDSGGNALQFQNLQTAYREALQYANLCEQTQARGAPVDFAPHTITQTSLLTLLRKNKYRFVAIVSFSVIAGILLPQLISRDILLLFIWFFSLPILTGILSVVIGNASPRIAMTVTSFVMIGGLATWTAILGRFDRAYRNLFSGAYKAPAGVFAIDYHMGYWILVVTTIGLLIGLAVGWSIQTVQRRHG
jgi:hypothetical protein